jgi:SagB-type dehydrogenase family enzyme
VGISWREYHELTKHTPESLRLSPHTLDWATMPDPFRHYEGVPLLDLPAGPPSPVIPALQLLRGRSGSATASDGPAFLSQLFFYSAAVSASKRVLSTGYRYALRVNPSSGNLHPTEFHFLSQGLKNWPDGLYHYRPSDHRAEQRASGVTLAGGAAPLTLVLTTIAPREIWKYGDRAYRYCLHDAGHAWQAVALAAQALGCEAYARGHFPDDEIAKLCRLHEDEWPLLLIELRGSSLPTRPLQAADPVYYGGQANPVSSAPARSAAIEGIHAATKILCAPCAVAEPPPAGFGEITLPAPSLSARPFGEVARTRRSALNFKGGPHSLSLARLSALLTAATRPLSADFAGAGFIQLYLYVHRVEGLQPGVYRYWPPCQLEFIEAGDQQVMAAALSLGQELAGNACVAFSLLGDLARAARAHGDRAYRYVHFEAGAIGHRLYIAAEALGLGATGIGAFYDDAVRSYLRRTPPHADDPQVVYHFAIGYPVPDTRLQA